MSETELTTAIATLRSELESLRQIVQEQGERLAAIPRTGLFDPRRFWRSFAVLGHLLLAGLVLGALLLIVHALTNGSS